MYTLDDLPELIEEDSDIDYPFDFDEPFVISCMKGGEMDVQI